MIKICQVVKKELQLKSVKLLTAMLLLPIRFQFLNQLARKEAMHWLLELFVV